MRFKLSAVTGVGHELKRMELIFESKPGEKKIEVIIK